MAKSIRSKVKKRNRTEMRKTVGDPHQKMLQARCTAKLQNAVAFSHGRSITKLKTLLSNAQEVNPVVQETSKSGFSFRHPLAPPPLEAERARGRRLSDVKASLGGDDTVMGDADGYKSAASRSAGAGQDGDRAAMVAPKLKKKLKKTRRKNWYEYPSPGNPAPPSSGNSSKGDDRKLD